MKYLLLLLSIMICGRVLCQPSYTFANAPKPGYKSENKKLESIQGFDLNALTLSGADKTWDISGKAEDAAKLNYISIDQYPFKAFFPGANMATVDPDEPDTTFTMLEVNNSGVYWLGSYDTSATIVWKDKYILLPFPLTFGQNFQNGTEANVSSGGIDAMIDIQSNSNVEGWGMLTTNNGTYPVLKVKTKQITEITASGIPLGSSTFEVHQWFTSGTTGPIAEFTISETESIFGGIINDTSITYIHRQEYVANKDVDPSEMALHLSPNPSSDFIQIELPGDHYEQLNYSVINAEGKTVLSGSFKKQDAKRINVQNVPTGNYFVQVVLDNKNQLFDIVHIK